MVAVTRQPHSLAPTHTDAHAHNPHHENALAMIGFLAVRQKFLRERGSEKKGLTFPFRIFVDPFEALSNFVVN